MNDILQFQQERQNNISSIKKNESLQKLGMHFLNESAQYNYSYNFDWLGLPIIQYPQDIIALQEIIWRTKPTLIIETGVARGGSLVFYASILQLLNKNGRVIGVDIDIREHNKQAIQEHPLSDVITLIEGSSTSLDTLEKIKKHIQPDDKIMVILDSDHTHQHVLKELELYQEFVTKDFYLVVLDTVIEDMPDNAFPNRNWGKGNNPKTAVKEFLTRNDRFKIDENIYAKLLITVGPQGYLQCIK